MRFAGKAVRSAILASLWAWGTWACAAASTSDTSSDSSQASPEARLATRWILNHHDNQGKPFAVVDKKAAQLRIHAADGRLIGSSPALLGLAPGDTAIAGIAHRAPSSLRPFERTTPAGRFESQPGRNLHGEPVVWVDYDSGIAIHRVRPGISQMQRVSSLATEDPTNKRLSLGCVVVPEEFFWAVVIPTMGHTHGVVYVLPEDEPVQSLFTAPKAGPTKAVATTAAAATAQPASLNVSAR